MATRGHSQSYRSPNRFSQGDWVSECARCNWDGWLNHQLSIEPGTGLKVCHVCIDRTPKKQRGNQRSADRSVTHTTALNWTETSDVEFLVSDTHALETSDTDYLVLEY
jgi:hypothetical protein